MADIASVKARVSSLSPDQKEQAKACAVTKGIAWQQAHGTQANDDVLASIADECIDEVAGPSGSTVAMWALGIVGVAALGGLTYWYVSKR
jgi:hypothetical protein